MDLRRRHVHRVGTLRAAVPDLQGKFIGLEPVADVGVGVRPALFERFVQAFVERLPIDESSRLLRRLDGILRCHVRTAGVAVRCEGVVSVGERDGDEALDVERFADIGDIRQPGRTVRRAEGRGAEQNGDGGHNAALHGCGTDRTHRGASCQLARQKGIREDEKEIVLQIPRLSLTTALFEIADGQAGSMPHERDRRMPSGGVGGRVARARAFFPSSLAPYPSPLAPLHLECNAIRFPSLSRTTARKPYGPIWCFCSSSLPPLGSTAAIASSRRPWQLK